MSALRSPNELVRVYLTRALVDEGTVAIDTPVRTFGPLADLARRDGVTYSDKAPGLSLLAASAANAEILRGALSVNGAEMS